MRTYPGPGLELKKQTEDHLVPTTLQVVALFIRHEYHKNHQFPPYRDLKKQSLFKWITSNCRESWLTLRSILEKLKKRQKTRIIYFMKNTIKEKTNNKNAILGTQDTEFPVVSWTHMWYTMKVRYTNKLEIAVKQVMITNIHPTTLQAKRMLV